MAPLGDPVLSIERYELRTFSRFIANSLNLYQSIQSKTTATRFLPLKAHVDFARRWRHNNYNGLIHNSRPGEEWLDRKGARSNRHHLDFSDGPSCSFVSPTLGSRCIRFGHDCRSHPPHCFHTLVRCPGREAASANSTIVQVNSRVKMGTAPEVSEAVDDTSFDVINALLMVRRGFQHHVLFWQKRIPVQSDLCNAYTTCALLFAISTC